MNCRIASKGRSLRIFQMALVGRRNLCSYKKNQLSPVMHRIDQYTLSKQTKAGRTAYF